MSHNKSFRCLLCCPAKGVGTHLILGLCLRPNPAPKIRSRLSLTITGPADNFRSCFQAGFIYSVDKASSFEITV